MEAEQPRVVYRPLLQKCACRAQDILLEGLAPSRKQSDWCLVLSRRGVLAARAVVLAVVVVAASCATERDGSRTSTPIDADSARVRRALHAELRALAPNPEYIVEFDTARVHLWPAIPSRAVPGLVYHRATLTYPLRNQGTRALVATRDTLIRPVRNVVDWSEIAAGWEPSSPKAAAWACAELYHLQYRRSPRWQAAVFGLDTVSRFFPPEVYTPADLKRMERQLPDTFIVENPKYMSSRYRVRLWVVWPEYDALAVEVACELPAPMWEYGSPAGLAVTRSLPRFVPDN